MYNNKKRGIIGVIITIIILIVVVIISNIKINNLSYIENTFSFFVMPIQNGLTYLKNWISGNNEFFTDISKLAIQVVKEHSEIREELKNYFYEIMIDEYQDTNDLQETFISLIANHNVYMVGDIKQSIYRFRNANPSIFKEKYDLYTLQEEGIKIDLNKNFRSL